MRIFRNEGVTGSNPVSSTETPGQDDSTKLNSRAVGLILAPVAPQTVHKLESGSTSSCARCFLTPPHLMESPLVGVELPGFRLAGAGVARSLQLGKSPGRQAVGRQSPIESPRLGITT